MLKRFPIYVGIFGGIFFFGVCSLVSAAEKPLLEFEGRYWMPSFSAKAKVVEAEIGSEFDAVDDLGIEDENLPDGRITWHTGPNSRLRLGYTQVDYSGSKDIARTIQFDGETYSAGTRVNSEMDIKYLRLGWIWQFINIANDKVKLGTIVEAKALSADVSLEAPNAGISESEYVVGGLPTVGLALDINPVKNVTLFGEVSGLSAGRYGHFVDVEAGLEYKLCKYFSINGGYRLIDLKVDYDSNLAKLQIAGPFAGGKISF
jgi:hypothetical protein